MNRVLIVFAKYPRPGSVKTRLGKAIGMDRAAEVYEEIARDVFSAAEVLAKTAVYLYHDGGDTTEAVKAWVARTGWTYSPQAGSTLGERMHNAFARVFREGADNALIVGTDTPGLGDGTLERGFALLETADIVIGPAADGGYYLLGMRAPLRELFTGIPWSTPDVFSATLEAANAARLTVAMLDERTDIDTEDDYRAYLARLGRGA